MSKQQLLSCISIAFLLLFNQAMIYQKPATAFEWPERKQIALSLTFDDARESQVQGGTALLDQLGVKATFYVLPEAVESQLEGWRKAKDNGHEIGNHSQKHPCSGNFEWARANALEGYSMKQMKRELLEANKNLENLLGVKVESFAYPCGQTFIRRGKETKSYVPIVADLFITGRGWLDEAPNDPTYCDFAQLTGIEMDGKNFEDILPILEKAKQSNHWVVLAGHEMGESGAQTTRLSMLKKLIEYSKNPANGVWIAPVGTVAKYVSSKRK
jgi:peptidoglycan-N-acetylglucosamine deacetylase